MESSSNLAFVGDKGFHGSLSQAHDLNSHRDSSKLHMPAVEKDLILMEEGKKGKRPIEEGGGFDLNELQAASGKHGIHSNIMETITDMDPDLYMAAIEGTIETFNDCSTTLDLGHILTPNKNTILHVYLATRMNEQSAMTYFDLKHFGVSIEFIQQIVKLSPSLLTQSNDKGEIPLHIAARKGLENAVKVLIEESKVQYPNDLERGIGATKEMLRMSNDENETALHLAIQHDYLEVVRLLTKEDPDYAYSINDCGETPIYIAARKACVPIVATILDTCTSVDYSGPDGTTALHAAILNKGNAEIVSKIIDEKPCLMKISDKNGWIPLHYAAYFGYDDIVELLLENDRTLAYIAVNDSKITALHLATLCESIASMRNIIKKCPSSCELVDERGWNVFHYAVVSKRYFDEKTRACTDVDYYGFQFLMEYPWLLHLIHKRDAKRVTPYRFLKTYSKYLPSFMKHINADNEKHLKNKEPMKREEDFDIGVGPIGRIRIKTYITHEIKDEELRSMFARKLDKSRDSHLVVAALIATVTFAAAFTLPGGTEKGFALLSKSPSFQAFVITDALAMLLSTTSVFIHFRTVMLVDTEKPVRTLASEYFLTMVAMSAMVIAFVTGTYAVLAPSLGLSIATCFIGLTFFVFTFFPFWKTWHQLRWNVFAEHLLLRKKKTNLGINCLIWWCPI